MSRDRRSDPSSAPPQGNRDARRAAALRANLARRKAQARERDARGDNDEQTADTHPPQGQNED